VYLVGFIYNLHGAPHWSTFSTKQAELSYREHSASFPAAGERSWLEVVKFTGLCVAVEVASVAFALLGGTLSLTVDQRFSLGYRGSAIGSTHRFRRVGDQLHS
jgi:hypothetical protein